MKKLIFMIPFLFLLLTSCSSVVDDMHKELDEGDKRARRRVRPNQFDQFRKGKKLKNRARNFSTANRRRLLPKIKRKYEEAKEKQRRLNADDLKDNSDVGSLWTGSGNDGFLFTKDTDKRHGDIVVLNVFKKFKNEISVELRRTFPDAPLDESEKKKKEEKAAAETPKPKEAKDDEVIDRISTVVIEEINRDHLLVRGRKALLFKKRKRLVEVQALVNRRDIADDDSVGSNKFLESSIHVLR
jgi:flagellar L-ring protein precursor FlgH